MLCKVLDVYGKNAHLDRYLPVTLDHLIILNVKKIVWSREIGAWGLTQPVYPIKEQTLQERRKIYIKENLALV